MRSSGWHDHEHEEDRTVMTIRTVSGFAVATDLAYDLERHMWVSIHEPGIARIGMDSLGLETSGTLAQLSFRPDGEVTRGEPFGSLEAEKFVGPLVSPLSGRVLAVNESAMADPGLVERDPYGEGWFIEIAPTRLAEELPLLTAGAETIVEQFGQKVRQYRIEGVLAE
jgi:glycine cleavage system H protein